MQSGLTTACLNSPHTREFVAQEVLDYIKKWIPRQRSAVLAGNSIHADRAFLLEEMPKVVDHLHYRFVCQLIVSEVNYLTYSSCRVVGAYPSP